MRRTRTQHVAAISCITRKKKSVETEWLVYSVERAKSSLVVDHLQKRVQRRYLLRNSCGSEEMAHYQFLCLFAVAILGFKSTSSQTQSVGESTVPSLLKEVEDNSRYKTLEANATLLKLLVDDKDGVSSSEVFDMLHSRDDNEQHIDLPTFPEDSEDARADVTSVPDSQAEFLQVPGTVRRDSQRLRSGSRGEPIGAAAGIMVVVTCSIMCIAYTSLIVWRRIYLKRNGLKHELLRNEENVAETRIEL